MDFDNAVHGVPEIDFKRGNQTVGTVTALAIKGVTTDMLDYFTALTIKAKGKL